MITLLSIIPLSIAALFILLISEGKILSKESNKKLEQFKDGSLLH